jgi:MOSC domain-containing protein YiiM
MHIVSVNVGRPELVVHGERTYSTAINKVPAGGRLWLSLDGFPGDHVADSVHHGGPDKAVCCYPTEHYPTWQERLGHGLGPAAFGENLTTAGLLEDAVCIGDVLQIGRARAQVTQPRQPCWKLANKQGEPRLVLWLNEALHTGFYLRVLEPGEVGVGDAVDLLDRPHAGYTVARAMRVMLSKPADVEELRSFLAIPALSQAWREDFTRRLAGSA